MTYDIDRMKELTRFYHDGVNSGRYKAVGEMFNMLRTDDRMTGETKWAVGEFLSRYLDRLDEEAKQ